jgi:DNA polymerase elongation subunit (family B)
MNIEFEQAIYTKFVILSKKRYMYHSSDREGNCDGKIGKRGVVLARRDNSKLLRKVYERVIEMIFDGKSKTDVELFLVEYISEMFRRRIPFDQYIATKSIRSTDETVKTKGRIGDYKVKQLPSDEKERQQALNGRTERQYYIDSCPAQVQLAERMRLRGFPVDVGSRMEFVVLDKRNTSSLGKKMEDATYFLKRKEWLKIDNFYYLKSLINPVDQLTSVALGSDKFVEKQLDYRFSFNNVLEELKTVFAPKFRRLTRRI